MFQALLDDTLHLVLLFLSADMSVIQGDLVECRLRDNNNKKRDEIFCIKLQVQTLMLTCKEFGRHMSAILAAAPFQLKHMYGMLERHRVDAVVIKFNMHPDYLRLIALTQDEIDLSCIYLLDSYGHEFVGESLHRNLCNQDVSNLFVINAPPYSKLRALPPCVDMEILESAASILRQDWDHRNYFIQCLEVFPKPGHVVTFVYTGVEMVSLLNARDKAFRISQQPGFYSMSEINWNEPRWQEDIWSHIVHVQFDKLERLRDWGLVLQKDESFGGSFKCDLNQHEFFAFKNQHEFFAFNE